MDESNEHIFLAHHAELVFGTLDNRSVVNSHNQLILRYVLIEFQKPVVDFARNLQFVHYIELLLARDGNQKLFFIVVEKTTQTHSLLWL